MEHLKEWIEQVLNDNGCSLYELEWLKEEATPILRVSIEKKGGSVDLDTCTQCSDAISAMLDEKDWNDNEYLLEVCSPGAERELKDYDQIKAQENGYVFVKLKNPKQGVDQVFGDLVHVEPEVITLSYKVKGRPKKITIEMDNIQLIKTAVKL